MIRNPQNSIGNYLGTYILEWDLAFRAQSISERISMDVFATCFEDAAWRPNRPRKENHNKARVSESGVRVQDTIGPTGLQSLGFTASGGT